jgi:hypothetical protein
VFRHHKGRINELVQKELIANRSKLFVFYLFPDAEISRFHIQWSLLTSLHLQHRSIIISNW